MFDQARNPTIKAKLVFALVLFDIVLTAVFTWRNYQTHRDAILDGIDQRLHSAAQGIPFVLPEGMHTHWMDSTVIPESLYVPLSRELQSFANASGVDYLYSFMERNDSVFFFISSNTDSQFVKGNYVRFRDYYQDASDSLRACFRNGGSVFESTSDEFGSWRSALVRRETMDGKVFVLGADIRIRYVDQVLRASLIQSLLIGFVGFLLFLLVLLKIADSITVPIMRLEEQTRKLVDQHFDIAGYDTAVLEGIWKRFRDESGRLAHAFLLMLQDLATHIRKLQDEMAIRSKIESEMSMAGEIQKNYLPKEADPRIAGRLSLAGDTKPARSAGGDLFDFYMLDDRRMAFALGDVSDKGMPAALFMAITVTLLREASFRGLAPEEVVRSVNASLFRHNDLCQFVTLFYGVMDLDTGEVHFVNAGHNPPYLCHVDGSMDRIAQRHGPAVGVMPDYVYRSGVLQINPSELFLLYTDGITEAFNRDGVLYGEHRLETFLQSSAVLASPSEVLERLWKDVALHVDGAEQSDDITTLVLFRNPVV